MVLKRSQQILNFVIYIIFLFIVLYKSSCMQSCLDHCLGWRSVMLIEVFYVMASYGKGMAVHIPEGSPRNPFDYTNYNTPSNTFVDTPQCHRDVCWQMFNAYRYRHSTLSKSQKHIVTHFW